MPFRRALLAAVLLVLTLVAAAAPVSAATAAALPAPTVSSAQYPEEQYSPPVPGVFRFGANGIPNVVRFQYSFYSDFPQREVKAEYGRAKISFAPSDSGRVPLFVHSITRDGAISAARRYDFLVSSHRGSEVADWRLDEPATATAAVDRVSGRLAVLDGDAHFRPETGRRYETGDGSLALDASGDGAHVDGPLVDTSSAFTVMAWVRLPDLTDQSGPVKDRTIMSIDGRVQPGMWLGYDADVLADRDPSTRDGTFVLRMRSADTATARSVQAEASRGSVTNALRDAGFNGRPGYVHVTGVYDGLGSLRLYLNGELVDTSPAAGPGWTAPGPFRLGSRTTVAGTISSLAGDLDAVRVNAAALFDREILVLANSSNT